MDPLNFTFSHSCSAECPHTRVLMSQLEPHLLPMRDKVNQYGPVSLVSDTFPTVFFFRVITSHLFVPLVTSEEAAVQTQEGVADTQRAVHRGHQQGQERQFLLPRRQREDDLAGYCHRSQTQQVDGLQGTEQGTLTAGRRAKHLFHQSGLQVFIAFKGKVLLLRLLVKAITCEVSSEQ